MLHLARVVSKTGKELFGAQVAIVSDKICRRRPLNRRFLRRRKLRLKLIGDGFGNLALDGKDVVQRAVEESPSPARVKRGSLV